MSQSEASRREQALIEAHRYGGKDMSQLQEDRRGGGKHSRGYDNPNGASQLQEDRRFGGKDMNQLQEDRGYGGKEESQRQKDRRSGGKDSRGYDNPNGTSQLKKIAASVEKT